jgi:hypothetical protein
MDHYIKEALKKSKTIIIPEIGALTKISETTGELMFMNYLKYDDGTLAQFISNKEGITEQEAKNLLAKHSREITATLNKGEIYSIFKFGSFFKNEKGEFEFEQYKKTSKSTKSKTNTENKLEAESEVKSEKTKTKTKIKTQKDIELTKTETAEAILTNLDNSNPGSVIQEPELKKEIASNEEISHVPDTNLDVEIKTLEKPLQSFENEKQEQNSQGGAELNSESTSNSKNKSESKKNKEKELRNKVEEQKTDRTSNLPSKKPLIIGILVLFMSGAIGTILYLFVFNKEVQNKSNGEAIAKQNEATSIISDSINNDSISSINTVENEFTDSTGVASIENTKNVSESPELSNQSEIVFSKPYKIIAGTFQKSQFAEAFAKKLKKDGVNSKIINRNNQNFVIVDSFDDINSAKKALKTLKSTVKKAWVLKMD